MSTVKAIETEYAGCRFRSRLEARWAVFFDKLGVNWEYEAEGYETSGGRYLPDFWLPDIEVWAEVKGRMTPIEAVKLLAGIPDLRPAFGSQITPQLLVLGRVPMPGTPWAHSRFDTFHDRTIFYANAYWDGATGAYQPKQIGSNVGFSPSINWLNADADVIRGFAEQWTEAVVDDRLAVDRQVDGAYRAARSARFEFGERG